MEHSVRQAGDRWQHTRRAIDDVMTDFVRLLPKWESYEDELQHIRDVIAEVIGFSRSSGRTCSVTCADRLTTETRASASLSSTAMQVSLFEG